jgi:uncharacterized protein
MSDIIILPGIGGSGPTHWQSQWEKTYPNMRRFQPRSWDEPILDNWIAALDTAVQKSAKPPMLVAHSLACLLVVHWQNRSRLPIAGAFLVAVPDPKSSVFPVKAIAFGDVPQGRLRFPSLIVASSSDPYSTLDYTKAKAEEWGSAVVSVGQLGHINGDSGVGTWAAGLSLLTAFATGAGTSISNHRDQVASIEGGHPVVRTT